MNGYRAVVASKWFTLSEFTEPEDLKHTRGDLIHELDALRSEYGSPIHPSRHPDGLARMDGSTTSRHYVGNGRLCDAIDVFPEGRIGSFLVAVMLRMAFRGIGVYGDTQISEPYQPGPMVHLDRRPGQLELWVRQDGEYIYRNNDPHRFYEILGEILSY